MNNDEPADDGQSVDELRTRMLRLHAQLDPMEASAAEQREMLRTTASLARDLEDLKARWNRRDKKRLWAERMVWCTLGSVVTTLMSVLF